jgi:hypothetical protein
MFILMIMLLPFDPHFSLRKKRGINQTDNENLLGFFNFETRTNKGHLSFSNSIN